MGLPRLPCGLIGGGGLTLCVMNWQHTGIGSVKGSGQGEGSKTAAAMHTHLCSSHTQFIHLPMQ
eukprot:1158770-Pelagomonas_calceolata.AAC.1